MPERWVEMIPFILSAGQTGIKFSMQRVFEGLIIAFVAGGVCLLGAYAVLDNRLAAVEGQMEGTNKRIDKIMDDLYIPRVKNGGHHE